MLKVRWLVLWSALLACGCSSDGDSNPPGGEESGGSGGPDLSGCRTVCWGLNPRPVVPQGSGGPTHTTIADCNPSGLTQKVCPAGFACTGSETLEFSGGSTYTRAICEPTTQPVGALVFDILPAAPVDKVAVQLKFTLNGGAWPRSATAGAAGTLVLTQRASRRQLTFELPTQSDALRLDLARGDYDVTLLLIGPAIDMAQYPSLSLGGVLRVVESGEAVIDLKGTSITYSLLLDGAPFPVLNKQDSVRLSFVGGHGQSLMVSAQGPAALPARPVVLEPDTYRVTLTTSSAADPPTFPSGEIELAAALLIEGAPRAVPLEVKTYPVTGAIAVDGADLPSVRTTRVLFGANSFKVGPARPARYSGRLFAGQYDVWLDTSDAGNSMLPAGLVRTHRGFAAGPATLNLSVTTTTFSGTLTLNGAAIGGSGYRGSILMKPDGNTSSQFLSLASSGAATWSARVYPGTYAVSVYGAAPLPTYEIPLEPSLVIGGPRNANYNVNAATATLTVLDGTRQPADATVTRGSFQLRRAGRTDSSGGTRYVSVPDTGPLRASVLLETGTWEVEFQTGSSYTGLPIGVAKLPSVQVLAGTGASATFQLRGVDVTGELRHSGAPLPPALPGRTRGKILLPGASFPLPSTGPATFAFRVYPGIYDLVLDCSMNCDVSSTSYLYLASGLRYP